MSEAGDKTILEAVFCNVPDAETDAKSVLAAFERAVVDGTVLGVEPYSLHRISLQYSWLYRIYETLKKNAETAS